MSARLMSAHIKTTWVIFAVNSVFTSVSSGRLARSSGLDADLGEQGGLVEESNAWTFYSPVGDGVHELIAFRALTAAGFGGMPTSGRLCPPADVAEMFRGILYSDDPAGLVFADPGDGSGDTSCAVGYNRSLGAYFGITFALLRKSDCSSHTWPEALLCHSHYGQLQFLHGMANQEGESSSTTKALIMAYAEFAYNVAIGNIKPGANALNALPSILRSKYQAAKVSGSATVKDLYVMNNQGAPYSASWVNVAQRALGSIIHMFQDSYAMGHTIRVASTGEVLMFNDYGKQSGSKHANYDQMPASDADSKMAGFNKAVREVTTLLKYYRSKTSWSTVRSFIDNSVFKVSSNAVPSGTGQADLILTLNTAICSGCGSAYATLCYAGGYCTEEIEVSGLKSGRTKFERVQTSDMGCLSSLRLRKGGSGTWTLNTVSVFVRSAVCKRDISKQWQVGSVSVTTLSF